MISLLRGVLRSCSDETVILETGGIGYSLFVPRNVHTLLPGEGKDALLYTHLIVKEDQLVLYGFASEEERDLFRQLLGVSGLGPKVALSLLSYLEHNRIYEAISQEDVKTLTTVPGVGRKSAQRLIFELKEKLPNFLFASPGNQRGGAAFNEALEALVSLGYTQAEVVDALHKAQEDTEGRPDGAELTRKVLRQLSSG